MAYDEKLASRFRDALNGLDGISEKRMMGGVCFLLHGNMIGGADRTKDGVGRFMFRVGKENHSEAVLRSGAIAMVQGGRNMTGFFFVHDKDCDAATLNDWIAFALSFVAALPPK